MKHEIANFLRKYHLSESNIYKFLTKINALLFHDELRTRKKTFGKNNPDKIFYVIRRNNMEEGLLSMFFSIAKDVEYVKEKGYIPYIDLQNYKTQYLCKDCINGTYNAWEYYFKQPSDGYTIDDIYKSKNVILGGRRKSENTGLIADSLVKYDYFDDALNDKLYCWIKNYIDVQDYIYRDVENIWKEKFEGRKVIGVFCRGTDYIAFSPKGHPVQPSKEMIKTEISKLKEKYQDTSIFIVTEDEKIYSYLSSDFKETLIEIEDIRFSNYKGDDYIAKYCKDDAYRIGYVYLIKLLLLSKCNYLITSKTNGSKFANIMNDNHYEEKIVIDLGVYE